MLSAASFQAYLDRVNSGSRFVQNRDVLVALRREVICESRLTTSNVMVADLLPLEAQSRRATFRGGDDPN
jgi:hypothetical protein